MTDQNQSEIDQLWISYSKDDLWKSISDWWDSASRARVVMLLAMHHKQSLLLSEIVEKAGTAEPTVLQVLRELQDEGVVECREDAPERYAISNESAFLKHLQQCCERTSIAAGMLGTLANWASGKPKS